jgi:hypothetical protein
MVYKMFVASVSTWQQPSCFFGYRLNTFRDKSLQSFILWWVLNFACAEMLVEFTHTPLRGTGLKLLIDAYEKVYCGEVSVLILARMLLWVKLYTVGSTWWPITSLVT